MKWLRSIGVVKGIGKNCCNKNNCTTQQNENKKLSEIFFDQSCARTAYMRLFPILFMKQQIVSLLLKTAEVS